MKIFLAKKKMSANKFFVKLFFSPKHIFGQKNVSPKKYTDLKKFQQKNVSQQKCLAKKNILAKKNKGILDPRIPTFCMSGQELKCLLYPGFFYILTKTNYGCGCDPYLHLVGCCHTVMCLTDIIMRVQFFVDFR